MTLIKVSFGALQQGTGDIRTSHGQLQSMFNELQDLVKQLLPNWTGEARDAYYGVQQQWNQLNQTLAQGLQGMGTGVDTARANFQQAEKANRSMWGA
jgi:WXG100 family type VII secretion target